VAEALAPTPVAIAKAGQHCVQTEPAYPASQTQAAGGAAGHAPLPLQLAPREQGEALGDGDGVGVCEGVGVGLRDGVTLDEPVLDGVCEGDTLIVAVFDGEPPGVRLDVGVGVPLGVMELLGDCEGVGVPLAVTLPVGEAEGGGEEVGVREAEGGGGEADGDGGAPSATVSVAVRCVPVLTCTKTAKKVTAPEPTAGAVQRPEAEVTLVALGCVMPPAQELMARAAEKGAETVPSLAAAKVPGYAAPAKPATAKPFHASVPPSFSVCATPGE
jgi:hypothetical protein